MPTVTILRKNRGQAERFSQRFAFEAVPEQTVIELLAALNDRETLKDETGAVAPRISYDCSCETGVCGACAMLVNGTPRLACSVRVMDALNENGELFLEPLSKFDCVCDLVVDRSVLHDRLKELGLWPTTPSKPLEMNLSACLQCGLCAEACEKFGKFDAPSVFAAAEMIAAIDTTEERRKPLKKMLKKSLRCPCRPGTCEQVCPMGLPIRQAIKKVAGAILPF